MFFLTFIFTVHSFSITSEKEQVLTGSITGYVIDADTKTPFIGTNIIPIGEYLSNYLTLFIN